MQPRIDIEKINNLNKQAELIAFFQIKRNTLHKQVSEDSKDEIRSVYLSNLDHLINEEETALSTELQRLYPETYNNEHSHLMVRVDKLEKDENVFSPEIILLGLDKIVKSIEENKNDLDKKSFGSQSDFYKATLSKSDDVASDRINKIKQVCDIVISQVKAEKIVCTAKIHADFLKSINNAHSQSPVIKMIDKQTQTLEDNINTNPLLREIAVYQNQFESQCFVLGQLYKKFSREQSEMRQVAPRQSLGKLIKFFGFEREYWKYEPASFEESGKSALEIFKDQIDNALNKNNPIRLKHEKFIKCVDTLKKYSGIRPGKEPNADSDSDSDDGNLISVAKERNEYKGNLVVTMGLGQELISLTRTMLKNVNTTLNEYMQNLQDSKVLILCDGLSMLARQIVDDLHIALRNLSAIKKFLLAPIEVPEQKVKLKRSYSL
jgi:hypothetical protein